MRLNIIRLRTFTKNLLSAAALICTFFYLVSIAKKPPKHQKRWIEDDDIEPDSTWSIPIISLLEQVEEGYEEMKLGIFDILEDHETELDSLEESNLKDDVAAGLSAPQISEPKVKDIPDFDTRDKNVQEDIKKAKQKAITKRVLNKKKPLVHVHVPEKLQKRVTEHKEKVRLGIAPSHDQRIKVLLVDRWRTGGTFVSELFNYNEEVFYINEPLYTRNRTIPFNATYEQLLNFAAVSAKDSKSKSKNENHHKTTDPKVLISSLLKNYFNNCTVPRDGIRRFNRFNTAHSEFTDPEFIQRLTKSNHDLQMAKLKEKESKIPEARIEEELERACQKFDEICQTFSVRAAKTIRLKSLNLLPKPLKRKNALKVIYLVRDPRSIAATRIKKSKNWSYPEHKDKLKNLCLTYDNFLHEKMNDGRDHSTVPEHPKTWYNDVLVVRYEDATHAPLKTAHKIYNFIGKQLPEHLEKRIISAEKHHESHLMMIDQISRAWLRNLDWDAVKEVQNHCRLAFKSFGYTLLRNEQDFETAKNETSKFFVNDLGCEECQLPFL